MLAMTITGYTGMQLMYSYIKMNVSFFVLFKLNNYWTFSIKTILIDSSRVKFFFLNQNYFNYTIKIEITRQYHCLQFLGFVKLNITILYIIKCILVYPFQVKKRSWQLTCVHVRCHTSRQVYR